MITRNGVLVPLKRVLARDRSLSRDGVVVSAGRADRGRAAFGVRRESNGWVCRAEQELLGAPDSSPARS